MELNLFNATSYAVYGVKSDKLPIALFANQDEVLFEFFKKEFETHLSTIEYVGLEFYKQKEVKDLLRHCAKVVGYDGLQF